MDVFQVSIDENFWECNPQWKYHSAFKELYESDKSKNKEKSSKMLWAVMLYADATRSQFYLLPAIQREEEIRENYLKEQVPWADVLKYIEPYKKFVMSAAERRYMAQQDKMMERIQFLMQTPYDLESAPVLDKIQVDTPKLEAVLRELAAAMTGDQTTGSWRGGDAKSPVEQKKF